MDSLDSAKKKELIEKANLIRQTVIETLMEAGSGHTAGSLGMADIFTALYFHILRHNPDDPFWEERDRVVLSNGHICPVLYVAMAHSGYFPLEELKTLRRLGSRLQGHPHREYLPGLEASSGPLGCGLSQAVGMAIADRIDRGSSSERCFWALLSDGEMNSGNTWEGGMLASKEGLSNLIAIIDRNSIQIDGYTEDIMPIEPLKEKWLSWGWSVSEIYGHNFDEIVSAIEEGRSNTEAPSMIIANTIPGKGVSEFENRYEWHGKVPNAEEGERALAELKANLER